MRSSIRLATCGMSDADVIILRSLLKIINMKSNVDWMLCDSLRSDVIIVDTATELGQVFMELNGDNSEQLIIDYTDLPEEESDSPYVLNKPIRSARFCQLLKEVLVHIYAHRPMQECASLFEGDMSEQEERPAIKEEPVLPALNGPL